MQARGHAGSERDERPEGASKCLASELKMEPGLHLQLAGQAGSWWNWRMSSAAGCLP